MKLYPKPLRQSTHTTLIIIGTIIINMIVSYSIFYFLYSSRNFIVKNNISLEKNIELEEGFISIGNSAKVTGNISLKKGTLSIEPHATILGNISIEEGDVETGEEANIKGDVTIENGNIKLEDKVVIEGSVIIKKGEMEKHSSAQILKTKPAIYSTYDYPDSLVYFDVLPEDHKKAVGYIFLTKESNTSIRDDKVKVPQDYFDGIYYYHDKKLQSLDISTEESKSFFKNAKTFFSNLPERKLLAFSFGATTKNYAKDPSYADIYIPSEGARYTLIHEMGHVLDFKYDYTDHHDPLYPFISEDIAMNSYGATHPGEDFAEAYKYYVIVPEIFKELIIEKKDRQKKYDFLKQYVFANKEYTFTT